MNTLEEVCKAVDEVDWRQKTTAHMSWDPAAGKFTWVEEIRDPMTTEELEVLETAASWIREHVVPKIPARLVGRLGWDEENGELFLDVRGKQEGRTVWGPVWEDLRLAAQEHARRGRHDGRGGRSVAQGEGQRPLPRGARGDRYPDGGLVEDGLGGAREGGDLALPLPRHREPDPPADRRREEGGMNTLAEVYEVLRETQEQYRDGRYLALGHEKKRFLFQTEEDPEWIREMQPRLEAAAEWVTRHVTDVVPSVMADCIYWSARGELRLEVDMNEGGRMVHGDLWAHLEAAAKVAVRQGTDEDGDTLGGQVYKLYKTAQSQIEPGVAILWDRTREALAEEGIDLVEDEEVSGIYLLAPREEAPEQAPWLGKALADLAETNEVGKEERLPKIGEPILDEGRRILICIAERHPIGPEVYADLIGDLVLQFDTPRKLRRLRIALKPDGSVQVFCNGTRKTVTYDSSARLPNELLEGKLKEIAERAT